MPRGAVAVQRAPVSLPSTSQADDAANSQQVRPEHRMTFIQAMMDHGVLPEKDAKKLLRSICNVNHDAIYGAMLSTINKQLEFANFKLEILQSPVDKATYLGFINMLADEPSKMGTRYTPQQREWFKSVVELIAQKDPLPDRDYGVASSIELLNHNAAVPATQQGATQATAAAKKRLTKDDKQAFLLTLVQDSWLATQPDKASYYTLGVRTFMELREFILSLELPEAVRTAWMKVL